MTVKRAPTSHPRCAYKNVIERRLKFTVEDAAVYIDRRALKPDNRPTAGRRARTVAELGEVGLVLAGDVGVVELRRCHERHIEVLNVSY
jgi:hypothetical protein